MKYQLGKRIHVVGTTGSGKSTLASQISTKLGCAHTELDALWWEADWTNPSVEVLRQRVKQTTDLESWVVDGNYSRVRDIVWGRADTVIWLDFPLSLIYLRLFIRTVKRIINKEELWNGNRERFTTAFLSKESLFIWALQSYWRNKQRYRDLLRRAEYAHLQSIHLRSPREVQKLINSLD